MLSYISGVVCQLTNEKKKKMRIAIPIRIALKTFLVHVKLTTLTIIRNCPIYQHG